MTRITKVIFLFIFVELLFFIPIFLIVELHTQFYSIWLLVSGHTSLFFPIVELIGAQLALFDNIFFTLPSALTFTEREIIHIQDIVYILIGFYVFLASQITIVVVLLFSKSIRTFFMTRHFRKLISIFLSVGLMVSIAGLYSSFTTIFIFLHEKVFTNQYWLLPQDALLINIYPPQFFLHMLVVALTLSLIFYIILIAISIVLERVYGNNN